MYLKLVNYCLIIGVLFIFFLREEERMLLKFVANFVFEINKLLFYYWSIVYFFFKWKNFVFEINKLLSLLLEYYLFL